MSIQQIMAECDCQHEACGVRGYCMAARIEALEAALAKADELATSASELANEGCGYEYQYETPFHGRVYEVLDPLISSYRTAREATK
jgi:hypothetical protein